MRPPRRAIARRLATFEDRARPHDRRTAGVEAGSDQHAGGGRPLTNRELASRGELVTPPPDDSHYVFDLVGCEVIDEANGERRRHS